MCVFGGGLSLIAAKSIHPWNNGSWVAAFLILASRPRYWCITVWWFPFSYFYLCLYGCWRRSLFMLSCVFVLLKFMLRSFKCWCGFGPTARQSFKIHTDINCLSTDYGVFFSWHIFTQNAIGCTLTLCCPLFWGMVREAVRMDRLALSALTRTGPRSPTEPGSIAAECHLLGAAEHHQKTAPCIFSYWKVIFMRVNNSSSSLSSFCSFTQHPSLSPPRLIDAICKTDWKKNWILRVNLMPRWQQINYPPC